MQEQVTGNSSTCKGITIVKLSQSVAYAVQAALKLAEEPITSPISCGQLAASGQMPERFLLQILRDLTKQGILHSTRGGGGGFMLGRRPDDISLLDLIEAVDGPISAVLPGKGAFPEDSAERLQEALKGIADQVRRQLSAIRLCDLRVHADRSGETNSTAGQSPVVEHLFDLPHVPGLTGEMPRVSTF